MTRSILITGCSSGIGRHCALGMARRGWQVFATARRDEDVEALRAEGLRALYLDYRDEDTIVSALAAVLMATDGRLDALFNNGGYSQLGAVEDLPGAALREQFETNFFGWHELTRRAIPVMRRQGKGRIVMTSSVLGVMALGYRAAYVSSKFAVEGYTDALRIELAGSGIDVVSLQPGPIATKMSENSLKVFRRTIDAENSVHRDYYARRIASLEKGGNTAGQLGPEAMLEVLVKACEAPRPKTHYPVTSQTRIAGAGRRFLPRGILHRLAVKMTG
ncbi:SDR family NAD(P)-dependent oxidoreductase [Afifella sp. IM 167]|uniref:SDR family NAD(P)-dependent oxidoreductase n=1 Tax=Afifella sp. IM 167 TaxID=2033586 RepID=UPI001CC9A19D|nr:SDR family NAD(P)-dependent oxidoreductase [Afifella sp. IM 167]MBZ8132673.1 short-chain dehydrogenase [Afifella sp. IM 167]